MSIHITCIGGKKICFAVQLNTWKNSRNLSHRRLPHQLDSVHIQVYSRKQYWVTSVIVFMASEILNMSRCNKSAVHVPKTLGVKRILKLTTRMSLFAKIKEWVRFHLVYPVLSAPITSVWPLHKMTNSATKTPNWPLSIRLFSWNSFLPCGPCWRGLGIFWPKADLPLAGCGTVLDRVDFRTTPSVPLQTGVKFEHFVYPLRVESNVNKKCRLWRGTFCPLDAHTDDDFALMFLANQWATVVFLCGQWRHYDVRETAS